MFACSPMRVFFITREIEVMESRPGYDVASGVAEGQWLIGREGCRIEPALHGMRTGVGIADQVGTVIAQSRAAIVLPGQDREWLSGLQAEDTAQLPAMRQYLGQFRA